MLKTILKAILSLFFLVIAYFLFYPVPFEPVAYKPPPRPALEGIFAPNNKMQTAENLLAKIGTGPEDIAIGADSMLYTGYVDGKIFRFTPDGKQANEFADTGGRPLGMTFDAAGNLIVADALKGLLSVDSIGKVTVLTNEAAGTKIFYADHLDIAADGMIYFSDATQRNRDVMIEVWEMQATGRLLSYNPSTKETKVEMDDMRFANGVALGPNDDYLVITETFGMVINKFWLKGSKKGQKEVWVNELPGFPDNISYNGDGVFWLAMPNLRANKNFESLFDKPFLRKIVARMPKSVTEAQVPQPYGFVVGINEQGEIVHNIQDPTGGFFDITSATEFNGALYLGSLNMQSVGRLELH